MLHTFAETIFSLVGNMGYIGIFIMMSIEASFLPFPSELILIPAGNLVYNGEMSFIPLIIAATFGSIAGASVNYVLGYYLGAPIVKSLIYKYGKYIFVKQEHYTNSEKFFLKHGEISTFIGRFIPGVRSLISFPPGIFRMNLTKFLIYTAFAASIANTLLISIGYIAGENKNLIEQYSREVLIGSILFISVLVIAYIWYNKKKG